MKLYFALGACSLSPHIVAEELGMKLELEKVDLSTHRTASGEDYLTINPKGYVPALRLDNGDVLTEGIAISQYLADQRQEAKLVPAAGTIARYRLEEWLVFITAEIHKSYSLLWNKNLAEETRMAVVSRLQKRLGFVDEKLEGKEFLFGDHFTIVDAYCFTVISWSELLHVDISTFKNIPHYLKRIGERPSVQAAKQAEQGR